MLEGLNQVGWSQLSHAYGPADDLPGHLRDLASPDGEVREAAVEELFGSIWHQGTVYSATAVAVPFLIELLVACPVAPRTDILLLLQCIARGSSYLDVHQQYGDFFYHERGTPEYQAQRKQELEWVRAARAAVLEGTSLYLRLFSDADPGVRALVPYLLASCGERAGEIEPELVRRLDLEAEAAPRSSVVMALAALWQQIAADGPGPLPPAHERCRLLAGLMRSEREAPAVRFAAAAGLMLLAGDAFLEEARSVFWRVTGPALPVFRELPWWDDDGPLSAASMGLRDHPERHFNLLLAMLGHPDAELRREAVWELAEVCRRRRSAPAIAVPALLPLLTDPDAEVRSRTARALPALGAARHLAVEPLQALLNHPDREIRKLARETLAKVRQPREKHAPGYWLARFRPPSMQRRSIAQLVKVLETDGETRGGRASFECCEAAACLELKGPAAGAAIPALRQALHNELHWVRVFAARALWKITGDAAPVLRLLTRELAGQPADYVILDCLGEMGPEAQAAVPHLRRIAEGEERVLASGSEDEWVDEDEGLRAAARQALARILGLRAEG